MTDKYSSLTLPSDYDQMESLIKSNKIKLMEQIVSSICYAVDNNLNAIEVFNFKDSDFIEETTFTLVPSKSDFVILNDDLTVFTLVNI